MTWTNLDGRWWLEAAMGGTIVLALGSLAAKGCRQPVQRARVVVLTVLGCLAVPWLGSLPIAPRWSARLPAIAREVGRPASRSAEVASSTSSALRTVDLPTMPDRPTQASPTAASVRTAEAGPSRIPPISWPKLALLAYAAATAGLASWWLIGQAMLWRVARSARPASARVREAFLAVSGPEGERVRLLESDRIALPFTFTWARPAILLPSEMCLRADSEELLYALGHEWSHVERRDYRTWTLVALAGLLLFYQPLFWWLRRQLRLCQDYLADDRAAALGSPEGYAAYLVRLARRRVAGPSLPALGIGDRRSNLNRRVTMLVQDRDPWERRCRTLWGSAAAIAAAMAMVVASGIRLDASPAGGTPPPAPRPDEPKEKPAMAKAEEKGELLNYWGVVKDKETGKPIEGATVTVRRSILRPGNNENKLLQETKHVTDAEGKYRFTILPEQSAEKSLYIELDLEHPDHATQSGFGYALGMIRKNETMGGRPFFENLEMYPGKPITGRVHTPEGEPAKGVKVLAFSRTDKVKIGDPGFVMGSFTEARTDDSGNFRVQLATPGLAVFWILPADQAPEIHPVADGKRGDLGTFTLKKGVVIRGKALDAEGKAAAGILINAERDRAQGDEILGQLMVSDSVNRTAVTGADGSFAFNPLPAGTYQIMPGERSRTWENNREIRPLPGVFVAQKLTLGESEAPEPMEIRAVPHVVIEAQWVDGKGKPTFGFESHIFGRFDGTYWMGQARVQAEGKVSARVPHGLEDVQLGLMTNEHHAIKYRLKKDGPLLSGRQIMLGTLDHDVKGIEIVHYKAPILTVKVQTGDGKPVPGLQVGAVYTQADPDRSMRMSRRGALASDVNFEVQEDGRHRSSQLLPDSEVVLTAQGEGFKPSTAKFNLPEGKAEDVVLTLEPK